MKKCIFVVVFLLVIAGIVTGSVLLKEEESKTEKKEDNKNISECNECVDAYDFDDDSAKILLGNEVKEIKVKKENNKETLIIGNKTLITLKDGESFYHVYVFNNEAILVTTTGEEYRNVHPYFYDKDLKAIDVDMTLDEDYPKSMVMFSSDDIEVDENIITIYGSRTAEGMTLIDESLNKTKLCVASGEASTYTKNHTGELLGAKYEMEYLGNSKFSKAKKVSDVRTLDETICYFE